VARAADDLGLRGELVFVGQGQAERLRAELGGLIAIVSVGHVDEAEAAAVLRGTFLQYLNYPFGWRDRVLRQTSFPSKLATYIAAAVLFSYIPPQIVQPPSWPLFQGSPITGMT